MQKLISSSSVIDAQTMSGVYLDILYQDNSQIQENSLPQSITETAGEVLAPSIERLLKTVPLDETDVFIDLGSGHGKICAQVFLQSKVREVLGIEIVREYHARAVQAAAMMQRDLPELFANGRKLTFLAGSFLDIPMTKATVVFINAVCFSPEMMEKLGKMIEYTPGIHTVMSLRPVPRLNRLRFQCTFRVEGSWDSALCYIYTIV